MYIAEILINALFTDVAFRRDSDGDGSGHYECVCVCVCVCGGGGVMFPHP